MDLWCAVRRARALSVPVVSSATAEPTVHGVGFRLVVTPRTDGSLGAVSGERCAWRVAVGHRLLGGRAHDAWAKHIGIRGGGGGAGAMYVGSSYQPGGRV